MENKKVGIGIGVSVLIIILLTIILIFGLKGNTTYKVTFDLGNNGFNEVVEVEKNGTVTKPADPTKEGYIFEGWYYNGVKFDFSSKITEDITLEAKWLSDSVQSWTVTFDSNGGSSVESVKVEDGKTIGTAPTPTRNGYTFKGWYYGTEEFDFDTVITKDITLTAKWEENKQGSQSGSGNGTGSGTTTNPETVTYSVKFDTDGGTTVKTQVVDEGKTATKPTDPEKDGYTFIGWYNGTKTFDFSTKITSNITLTAKWEKIVEEVKVSYKIVELEGSLGNQAKLYILKGDDIVKGTIDVTSSSGKTITKTVETTGHDITLGAYTYSNPKVLD